MNSPLRDDEQKTNEQARVRIHSSKKNSSLALPQRSTALPDSHQVTPLLLPPQRIATTVQPFIHPSFGGSVAHLSGESPFYSQQQDLQWIKNGLSA